MYADHPATMSISRCAARQPFDLGHVESTTCLGDAVRHHLEGLGGEVDAHAVREVLAGNHLQSSALPRELGPDGTGGRRIEFGRTSNSRTPAFPEGSNVLYDKRHQS
ncbi:hypothetical protein OG718_53675 [Streptomyces sp. NBC_00258]|nr:hypothetical protein [Streptomyces sp. NBC_00258]